MLFPTDPKNRPSLWKSFSDKVASGSISFLVHSSKVVSMKDRQKILAESVEAIVDIFKAADVVRFGSSHGNAIGPFFAFDVLNENAKLTEFAIDSSAQATSDDEIQEALQSIALNLFFEKKQISRIFLPITLPNWEASEWDALITVENTVLTKRVPEP